jgi:hypothetical protein
VAGNQAGSAYLHPGWLAALQTESATQLVGLACEDDTGTMLGVLPLMGTRGLPFNLGAQQLRRRLASLPRTPVAGPLANSDESLTVLLEAAVAINDLEPGRLLQIKSDRLGLDRLVSGLICTPWRSTYVVELPEQPDRPRFGDARNHSRIRWAVNKAARAGVRVRAAESEADLQAWYRLYLETMRRHAVPPRSYRFFAALWRELPPSVLRVLLAERGNRPSTRLLAGSIFLAYGSTVHYAFNGSRRADLEVRPNDAILWQAIHDAAADGYRRFDLGEVADERSGLADFKSKWGARGMPLWRYYHPPPAATRSPVGTGDGEERLVATARRLWRRLPLEVTSSLGGWIYERL